jgi:hypothetical protein
MLKARARGHRKGGSGVVKRQHSRFGSGGRMCQGAFVYEPFIAAEGTHVRREESWEGASLPVTSQRNPRSVRHLSHSVAFVA